MGSITEKDEQHGSPLFFCKEVASPPTCFVACLVTMEGMLEIARYLLRFDFERITAGEVVR